MRRPWPVRPDHPHGRLGGACKGRRGTSRRGGVSEDRILFGQSTAFSGPAWDLGRNVRLGIEAAFEEANRQSGVHGRTLALRSLDDAYEPEAAIANLLDEHVRLAYHSAWASDERFQFDIVQDFDPALGSLDVVARNVGRVFLNLVGNACQATAERQRAEEGVYEPSLTLVTRRSETGIEIRIRDNGNGIPPDIIDDIFNPFFRPSRRTRAPASTSRSRATSFASAVARSGWSPSPARSPR